MQLCRAYSGADGHPTDTVEGRTGHKLRREPCPSRGLQRGRITCVMAEFMVLGSIRWSAQAMMLGRCWDRSMTA